MLQKKLIGKPNQRDKISYLQSLLKIKELIHSVYKNKLR